MAERRMFSKNVIESDPFMDMPAEAQMLYIHLNMASDDDGFCDNPRAIMRQCGASDDSMKLLIAKKFVLTFDKNDGFVAVIKHWRINNYIRKDNYRETKYKAFMRELYYDENRSYSLNPNDGHKPCLPSATEQSQSRTQPVDGSYTSRTQSVDEPLTQDRIGKSKDRVGKESKGKDREEKDNKTSFSQEGGKGECERENQAPPDFPQSTVDSAIPADPAQRRAQIAFWKKRVDFFKTQKYDPACMYNLALTRDGITQEEIDSYREEET